MPSVPVGRPSPAGPSALPPDAGRSARHRAPRPAGRRRPGALAVGALLAASLAAACGDGGTEPQSREPGVRLVAGATGADTVRRQFDQALVVEVRGAGGRPAPGLVVRFEPRAPADTLRRNETAVVACPVTAAVCEGAGWWGSTAPLVDSTDANGRASVLVRLGTVAGRAVLRVVVPELGVADSAVYEVRPGAVRRLRFEQADLGVPIGGQVTLQVAAADQFGNARTEPVALALDANSGLELDAAARRVTGRRMGDFWVRATAGAARDSARVSVVPPGRLVLWSGDQPAVRMLNTDGTAMRAVATTAGGSSGAFPRFSPNGARIGFLQGGRAVLVDSSGAPSTDLSGVVEARAVRPLDDGGAWVVGRSANRQGTALWRVRASDAAATEVAVLPDAFGDGYGMADVTLDGARVVYVARTAEFDTELRVLDVASGVATPIPNTVAARAPRLSPDGRQVAYLAPDSDIYSEFDGRLVVSALDGSNRRRLGNWVFSSGIAWSPDGQFVAARHADFSGIRAVTVADPAASTLVTGRRAGGQQWWGPDFYQPDWR